MKTRLFGIGLLLFAAIFGCEKVIDVPINEADRRIVVEAVLMDVVGESEILLSRTGSIYQDSNFEEISGALITVTDQNGVQTVFVEDSLTAGRYIHPNFVTMPNSSYFLSINVEGEILTSETATFGTPLIDSITYEMNIGGFGPGAEDDTSFLMFYNFVDDGSVANYYRVIPYVNGVKDRDVYIVNDDFYNGQSLTAPMFATSPNLHDTVLVKLLSMDESVYEYFVTFSANTQSGIFSSAPSNPVTNINGNAIGYFGAFTSDTISIIIE